MGAEGTLELGPEDGHTRWVSAAASGQPAPFLSGTHELSDLSWQPHSGKILKASLPPSVGGFATLIEGGEGRRLIRARTPNGDPERTDGLCFMGNALLPSESCAGYIPSAGKACHGLIV